MTPDLVCRIRDLVTTVVSREGYIDYSEDVGQEFVVELLRRPQTEGFLTSREQIISQGKLPGKVRNHVLRLAARMYRQARGRRRTNPIEWAREQRLATHNEAYDPDRNSYTTDQMQDPRSGRDWSMAEARLDSQHLVERDPFLAEIRKAYTDGCSTYKQVAARLGVSDKTLYNRLKPFRDRVI